MTSRIEELLRAIIDNSTYTEPRLSRVERLLYAILTGGSHDEPTLSEMEDILLCILHGERYDGPTNSRISALLKVKANGGSYDEPRLSRIEELIYEWINGGDISIYAGTLPTTLQTVAGFLAGYKIFGNTEQTGTPTPDNPIVTNGCGVRTENLAPSIDEWGNGYVNTQGFIAPADDNFKERYSPHITVEPGTTYQLAYQTGTFPVSPTSLSWIGVGWYNDDGFIERTAGNYRTAVTLVAPANATYAIVSFRSYGESYNMMFVKATTAPTFYIPYGYKLPILSNDTTTDIYIGDTALGKDEFVDSEKVKIYKRTENLLDQTWLNDDTQLSATSGLPLAYTGRIAIINPIDVSNVDTVTLTFSLGTTSTEYFMYSIFSGTTLIERTAGKTSGNIINVTNADTLYICLYIGGRNITVNDVQWIMLNTGSTALPYVPYLTPTDPPVPLPLIPTAAGETTISYGGTGVQPEKVELKYR